MEIMLLEDPACPWCWGFQPVITALEFEFLHGCGRQAIRLRHVMGGASDRPVLEGSFAAGLWTKAAEISGMPFRVDIWDSHLLRTTHEACRVVKAAQAQSAAAGARLLRRMQEAFFTEGVPIDRRETLVAMAIAEGLASELLRETLEGGRANHLFQHDRHEAGSWSFGFPTLVIRKHPTDTPVVLQGVVSYDEVLEGLYTVGLSPRERRRFTGEAPDWERLFSVHPRLAPAEVAMATGLEGEALTAACAGQCIQEGAFLLRNPSPGPVASPAQPEGIAV